MGVPGGHSQSVPGRQLDPQRLLGCLPIVRFQEPTKEFVAPHRAGAQSFAGGHSIARGLGGADMLRHLILNSLMRPVLIEKQLVLTEHSLQPAEAKKNQMIEALLTN